MIFDIFDVVGHQVGEIEAKIKNFVTFEESPTYLSYNVIRTPMQEE